MDVKFTEKMCEAIGWKKLASYDLSEADFSVYRKVKALPLARLPPDRVKALREILEPHRAVPGVGAVVKDILSWEKVLAGDVKEAKARNCQQAVPLLIEYIRAIPGRRLYHRDSEGGLEVYYVNGVHLHTHRGDGSTWYTVSVDMLYREFSVVQSHGITFHTEDVRLKWPEKILGDKGYFAETAELRAEYMENTRWFEAIHDKVGKQFEGTGMAMPSLDGNDDEDDRYSRWNIRGVQLDKGGEPARVVIDVYSENGKESRSSRDAQLDRLFWASAEAKMKAVKTTGVAHDEGLDDDDIGEMEDIEVTPEGGVIEIPIHPTVAVFDLKRHLRLACQANQLKEHVYDKALGDRLVLPKDSRSLVDMLVAHEGGFHDVIRGKGGGAVILCAGPPGVGKTLTAEVYSETEERPLYSVQCSQLGTSPDGLEKQLLKVFARANRWNAILLLDEADVYVMARGRDLQQNAIVGVFLRLLEYYSGVLFMTTNRSDSVDDAIASRCIARIDYKNPKPHDLKRIWKVIAGVSDVKLDDAVVDKLVAEHPNLSGRDVKNLLKLGKLVSAARRCPVTPDVIRFVKRFKPTLGDGEEVHDMPAPVAARDVSLGQWYYVEPGKMMWAESKDDAVVTFGDEIDVKERVTLALDNTVVPANEE